jgi:hypothetical protein
MIQGAIGEYMSIAVNQKIDLKTYCDELVSIISQAVKGAGNAE